jgi:hypothetical protein
VSDAAPRAPKAQRFEPPAVARRPAPPDLASSIAAKDLFDASRSALAEGSAAAIVPTEPVRPLTLVLMGVSMAGSEPEVLVKDQALPKAMWLRAGEEVGGYKLGRIEPRSIVMIGPAGEEVTLFINVEKGKAPAVPTGPAGVQPPPQAVPSVPGPARTRPGMVAAGASPAAVRTPSPDIKEKIERLREEARKRRASRPQEGQ